MKLILEFDDFNPRADVNCLASVEALIDIFPDIKLTLFTSPLYEKTPLFSDKEWCNRVRNHIESNNVRLAVHGLYHTTEEFKHKSYEDALLSIKLAEDVFEISDLPYLKVFRGPQWGINDNTYKALEKLNYEAVYTHEDYKHLIPNYTIKSLIYNWNVKDTDCTSRDLVIGHGHTHNVCNNGIQESFVRIVNFINTNKPMFLFANEFEK